MHELSIAKSILDTLTLEKEKQGLSEILGVTVRIGALSGVLPDALEFGFEILRQDSVMPDCKLHIESVPISFKCKICTQVSTVEAPDFSCPACGSTATEMINGYELDIAYIDVRDEEET